MFSRTFDPAVWASVPFHFWSVVFFALGSIIGSFLNVCIHRMPLGQSVVSPPSHCPHCQYSIPWYLNIPLVTWLYLRGRCRNCGAPIAVRYFLVELLTAACFLACWLVFGRQSALLALIYAAFLAGLIAATFIDFEHFIIPDEITIGGAAVGFICSFVAPRLHGAISITAGLKQSLLGIAVGAGSIYLIVRVGKLVFGRQRIRLPRGTKVIFTEAALVFPDREILFEEIFYRQSDTIRLEAQTVELVDRCYSQVPVRLTPSTLRIGDETFKPEEVHHMETVTDKVVLPREAMGLGDVKFMAAIGAFLGWQGVIFSLAVSSVLGSVVGLTLLALGRRPGRIAYGPYISLAAILWIFAGPPIVAWYLRLMNLLLGIHY